MNKTALILALALTSCTQPQPENIKAVELLPIDSLAKLADQVLNQMQNNKALNMAQMDSVISHSKLTAGQMEAIKQRIRNRQILIKDTLVINKIYQDTVIRRVIWKDVIKLDTIRDTIRDTILIIDTVVTKRQRGRKKRRK